MQHDTKPQNAGPRDEDKSRGDTLTAAQKEEAERTDPARTRQRPKQTAEVPLGTGERSEPPGGGGREAQQVSPDKQRGH
ncbi:hypothetical protein P3T20_005480 [Paraburkholderia sp. GAS206C]|jgi:hypothetical protein|uniref:hypothetical protein n=1 Tax=unclassified Paraburkholderia TaxID=2615204 RepID=UPI003D24B148